MLLFKIIIGIFVFVSVGASKIYVIIQTPDFTTIEMIIQCFSTLIEHIYSSSYDCYDLLKGVVKKFYRNTLLMYLALSADFGNNCHVIFKHKYMFFFFPIKYAPIVAGLLYLSLRLHLQILFQVRIPGANFGLVRIMHHYIHKMPKAFLALSSSFSKQFALYNYGEEEIFHTKEMNVPIITRFMQYINHFDEPYDILLSYYIDLSHQFFMLFYHIGFYTDYAYGMESVQLFSKLCIEFYYLPLYISVILGILLISYTRSFIFKYLNLKSNSLLCLYDFFLSCIHKGLLYIKKFILFIIKHILLFFRDEIKLLFGYEIDIDIIAKKFEPEPEINIYYYLFIRTLYYIGFAIFCYLYLKLVILDGLKWSFFCVISIFKFLL